MLLNFLMEQFDLAPLSSIFSLPLGFFFLLVLSEDLAKSQYYLDVLLASIDKIESHPDVNFQDIENYQKEETAKGILQPSTEENKKFNDSRKFAIKSQQWVKK